MRATFFSATLASILALTASGPAMAQHHGSVHSSGHAGVYHSGYYHDGHYHDGYYHDGHYYSNAWPYYVAAGIAWGAPFFGGSPGYSSVPTYDSYPAYNGYPPVTYVQPQGATPEARPVIMAVLLPKADAEVVLGETTTVSRGTERLFESPPLEPGQSYHYTVKARWMEDGKMVEQKRDVPVRAGEIVKVDFKKPVPESVSPPEKY
jgi:uncharacterized protein (TIGR03000 family)